MHGGCDEDRFCEQTAECLRLRAALKIAVRKLGGRLMISPGDWKSSAYDDMTMHEHAGGWEVLVTERFPEV